MTTNHAVGEIPQPYEFLKRKKVAKSSNKKGGRSFAPHREAKLCCQPRRLVKLVANETKDLPKKDQTNLYL